MSIKLTWINKNSAFDEVRVYRSSTPFDFAAMPAAIGTVVTGNSYDDTTAEMNQLYHYVLGVVKGTDEVLSPPKMIANMPYTGPGPSFLLRGDWQCGYFGELANHELFSGSELETLLGVTSGMVSTLSNTAAWHKFVFEGKILFIPTFGMRTGVSWNELYNLGLIFGEDGPGPASVGLTAVTQNAQVSRDGHAFRVRLPRASADGVYSTTIDRQSEWNRLFVPLVRDEADTTPKWSDYPKTSVLAASWYYSLMQEHNSTFSLATTSVSVLPTQQQQRTATSNSVWRPVLELIL